MTLASAANPIDSPVPLQSGGKPEDESKQQLKLEALYVSPDLYGLFVTEPLQLDARKVSCGTMMLTVCRHLFLALSTFATQLFIASHMNGVAMQKEGNQCPSTQLPLQLICVFIISASLMRKMRDTAKLAYLLFLAPIKPACEGLPALHERRLGFTERMNQAWKNRNNCASEGSMNWSLESITICWKNFSLLCVVLPRFLLAMFIAKAGVCLVVRTHPESAVIHTIATLFIGDFDSVIYTTFTDSSTKEFLATTDSVQVYVPDRNSIISFIWTNAVGPLITFAMTLTLVFTMRLSCTADSLVSASGPSISKDFTGMLTFW